MKKAKLTPSFYNMTRKGSEITHQVKSTLLALTETVEVIRQGRSGNTLVRDQKGRLFYCNSEDLSPINPVTSLE